jgi:hypothetical protein
MSVESGCQEQCGWRAWQTYALPFLSGLLVLDRLSGLSDLLLYSIQVLVGHDHTYPHPCPLDR